MRRALPFVDVDLGADHDRDARQQRGEPAVEARGEEERVDDGRLSAVEERLQSQHIRRPPQSRPQAQGVKRHAGVADFLADRSRLIDADHSPIELGGQMAHQIQHHLFRAAHGQRVREIHDAWARDAHGAIR